MRLAISRYSPLLCQFLNPTNKISLESISSHCMNARIFQLFFIATSISVIFCFFFFFSFISCAYLDGLPILKYFQVLYSSNTSGNFLLYSVHCRDYRLFYTYTGNNFDSARSLFLSFIHFQCDLAFFSFSLYFSLSSLFGDSLSRDTVDNYSYLALWNLTAYDLPLLDKDNSPRCTEILWIFSSGTSTEEVILKRDRQSLDVTSSNIFHNRFNNNICTKSCYVKRIFLKEIHESSKKKIR